MVETPVDQSEGRFAESPTMVEPLSTNQRAGVAESPTCRSKVRAQAEAAAAAAADAALAEPVIREAPRTWRNPKVGGGGGAS